VQASRDKYCLWLRNSCIYWWGNDFDSLEELFSCDARLETIALVEDRYLRSKLREVIEMPSLDSRTGRSDAFDKFLANRSYLYQYRDMFIHTRTAKKFVGRMDCLKHLLFDEVYWKCKHMIVAGIDYFEKHMGMKLSEDLQLIRTAADALIRLVEDPNLTMDKAFNYIMNGTPFNIISIKYNKSLRWLFIDNPQVMDQFVAVAKQTLEATTDDGLGRGTVDSTGPFKPQLPVRSQDFKEISAKIEEGFLDAHIIFSHRGKEIHRGPRQKGHNIDYLMFRDYSVYLEAKHYPPKSTLHITKTSSPQNKKSFELEGIFINTERDSYTNLIGGHLLILKHEWKDDEEEMRGPFRYTIFEPITPHNLEKLYEANGDIFSVLKTVADFESEKFTDRENVRAFEYLRVFEIDTYVYFVHSFEFFDEDYNFCGHNKQEITIMQNGAVREKQDINGILLGARNNSSDFEIRVFHVWSFGHLIILAGELCSVEGDQFQQLYVVFSTRGDSVRLRERWNGKLIKESYNRSLKRFMPQLTVAFILEVDASFMRYRLAMVGKSSKMQRVDRWQHFGMPNRNRYLSHVRCILVDQKKKVLRVLMNSSPYDDKVPQVWIVDMKVKL